MGFRIGIPNWSLERGIERFELWDGEVGGGWRNDVGGVRELGGGVRVERQGEERGPLLSEEEGWGVRSGCDREGEEPEAHVVPLCD